jgi:hypothetical protein
VSPEDPVGEGPGPAGEKSGSWREEPLARVAAESRRAYGKLTDPVTVAAMLEREDFHSAVPFAAALRFDTTAVAPVETARRIAEHNGLPALPA